MTDPSKKDIEILFRRLRSIPSNKVCFDCTAKNPTWASVTYGVFICIDCSAVHRGLGVHLTFVRSTQLDTSWTWVQLHRMQLGGNANAEIFFTQHNCTTKDAQTKYNSRAAQLYREKLNTAANQAVALHGNKLNLEPEPPTEVKDKDFDFFSEHTDEFGFQDRSPVVKESSLSTPSSETDSSTLKDPSFCLSRSDDPAPTVKKTANIGLKKVQTKRSGIGVASRKVGGLGAQKMSANFAEIEKEAELADKLKVKEVKEEEEQPQGDDDKITSIRLAYEDLVIQQKKEEDKLKAVDPKKALQFERLGMGLGARSGVSHSALNDMQTIQQENAETSKTVDGFSFDDFYSSYNPNNSYSMKNSLESRNLSSLLESRDSFRSTKLPSSDFEIKSPIIDDYSTTRKSVPSSSSSASNSTDAQKKFGSAKSISSDQFFSDSSDSNWERKSNLQRFEGSSSISSADYFGRNEATNRSGYASQIQTPDLEDVKESVRQGVTKVAGRLSSLANGVFSSIQEKYGGY